MNIKDISDVVSKWVTIISAIVGGVYALILFHDKISTGKKEVALSYVNRYNDDTVFRARMTIDKCINKNAELIKAAKGETALYNVICSMVRNNNIEEEIDVVVKFYDNLEICVSSGTCDESVAQEFFGNEAHNIHANLHPYFCTMRSTLNDSRYAYSLDTFSKAYTLKQKVSKIKGTFKGYSCPKLLGGVGSDQVNMLK